MQPTTNNTANSANAANAANAVNAGNGAAQQMADQSKIALAKVFHSVIRKVLDDANENANNK